jgi:hypothetical protein
LANAALDEGDLWPRRGHFLLGDDLNPGSLAFFIFLKSFPLVDHGGVFPWSQPFRVQFVDGIIRIAIFPGSYYLTVEGHPPRFEFYGAEHSGVQLQSGR